MQLYLSTKNGDESNAKARLYSPPDGYAAKRRFVCFLRKAANLIRTARHTPDYLQHPIRSVFGWQFASSNEGLYA